MQLTDGFSETLRTMCSNRLLATPLFALIFLLNTASGYAASKSNAASECGATFFIMTTIESENPKLGKYFTQLGKLADLATGLYLAEESSAKVTNGLISGKKAEHIRRVGELEQRKIESVLESCMGWANALSKKISKHNKTKSALKSAISRGPSPTSTFEYPFPNKSWLPDTVKRSVQLWKLSGRVTPDSIREALKIK